MEGRMRHNHLLRLGISVFISLLINFVIASNARVVSSFDDLSALDRIIGSLAEPPIFFLDLLIGQGPLLDRVWLYLATSFVFYAVLAWIILSMWSKVRARLA
jgi:hypothetical protein